MYFDKTLFLCSAAMYLGATLPCAARGLLTVIPAPAIELSGPEAAQAKRLAQDFKNAQERNEAAWRAFLQT